jgi:hypothetical protein
MNQHDLRLVSDAGDGRDVPDKHKIEFVVECHIDSAARGEHQERVAVRRRVHDRFGCDVGGCTGPVLNDEWLTKAFRQPMSDQPRQYVVRAARYNPDDDAHRP